MSEDFERELLDLLRETNERLKTIEAVSRDHIERMQNRDSALDEMARKVRGPFS